MRGKRLFSLLTRLTLSCLINTVIDEEALALTHEVLAVLLELEVVVFLTLLSGVFCTVIWEYTYSSVWKIKQKRPITYHIFHKHYLLKNIDISQF